MQGFCNEKMKHSTLKSREFFKDVYDVVRLIPKGRVTSYGAIASFLGASKSARLVGWAMNASHRLPDIPAHRVLNRNGVLTGKHHFKNPEDMQRLLETEGIEVKEDQAQHFSQIFWDPAQALKLL